VKVAVAVLALVAMTLLATGPVAAQYPQVADIQLNDGGLQCAGGADVTTEGSGFSPQEPVSIFFADQQIAQVLPNSDGAFIVSLDTPRAAAGEQTIMAEQALAPGEVMSASATVNCVADRARIAFGGPDAWKAVVLLAGLIMVGVVALVSGRRRAGAIL
jgi:hypothetical protein